MKAISVGSLLICGVMASTVCDVAGQNAILPLIVTTFAGTAGVTGSVDATGTGARFKHPGGLAIDGADNLYLADMQDHTIRKITPAGVVTTVAGKSGQAGSTDGASSVARFGGPPRQAGSTSYDLTGPGEIAVGKDGGLYVTDGDNLTVRKIGTDGVVSTLAGQPTFSGFTNGQGAAALFGVPRAIGVDSSGYLYVVDLGNYTIRVISPLGYVGTLPIPGSARPHGGLVIDAAGRVIVAMDSGSIQRITLSSTAPVVVNRALVVGEPVIDTIASQSRNRYVNCLALGSDGMFFFAETTTIRQISVNGDLSTLAGLDGVSGYADGLGPDVRFSDIEGMVVDHAGAIFVTDGYNSVVRKATRGAYATFQRQPQGGVVNPGQNFTLSVAATGNPAPNFQWSKNGQPISGATNPSLTLTDVHESDAGDYTVSAGNLFSTFTSSVATVSVASVPIVTAQPTNQTVTAGQSAALTVTATGAVTYQWQKNGVPISGATGSTLTISRIQPGDAGSYSVVVGNSLGTVTTGAATLTVNFGRIVNLSILTSIAGAGDNFTMGYVVGGDRTTGSKPLVIRAAGPSLGALGVPGTLDDPQFELFAGTSKVGGNDNWNGAGDLTVAIASVGAFAFVSATSKDAAALSNFASRDNSVVVSSADNGSGAVIAEIYDATPRDGFVAATPRLINVSVRKHLGSGLTVGFVLGGAAPTKVLIRAIGPALGAFGVAGVVADPQLALFNDRSVKIGENNDWGGTADLTVASAAVGAFALPLASKDAALLTTLPPGLYSVQVSGTGNTTGVALVEVYEVP